MRSYEKEWARGWGGRGNGDSLENAMSVERTQFEFLAKSSDTASSNKFGGSDKKRSLSDLAHVGDHHARSDTLHHHTTALVLLGQALAEVIDIGLTGRVDTQHRRRNTTGHTAQVNNRSTLSTQPSVRNCF